MEIICPWCGNEVDDTPEEIPFFQNVAAVDCAECGEPVIVRRVFSVSYSAEKDN
jgi:C4-type Zn-finger protein